MFKPARSDIVGKSVAEEESHNIVSQLQQYDDKIIKTIIKKDVKI